jgi:hypothetical protein
MLLTINSNSFIVHKGDNKLHSVTAFMDCFYLNFHLHKSIQVKNCMENIEVKS